LIYTILTLLVLVVAYVWVFSPLGTSDRVGITTAISMVALFIVTSIYAWHTRKMADEMREQRLIEVQPYLLLRLNPGEDGFVHWYELESPLDLKTKRTSKLPVTIRNEGKGTAMKLEAYLWDIPHPHDLGPYDGRGYLAPGDEWQTDMSGFSIGIDEYEWFQELKGIVELKPNYAGIVIVKYTDIHKQRTWVSYLCLESKIHPLEDCVDEGEQNIVELKKSD